LRGLAVRTERLAIACQAARHLAAILIWARRQTAVSGPKPNARPQAKSQYQRAPRR